MRTGASALKCISFSVLSLLFWPHVASAQVSSASLSGSASVTPASDFATQSFQDPWDMNHRTDLGWWGLTGHSVDAPISGLSNVSFQNGLFSGTSTNTDPLFYLLESQFVLAAPLGRNGGAHPIDANTYRRLAIRMNQTNPNPVNDYMEFFWSRNTIYNDLSEFGVVPVFQGWHTYIVDLPSVPFRVLITGTRTDWNGLIRSFRLDPSVASNNTIQIDWIRLVSYNGASDDRTVSWSGNGLSGGVDIYLDNDTNASATLGTIARGRTGNSYTFQAAALAPGTYYLAVRRAGTNETLQYTTPFTVGSQPTLTLTAPSDEGSPSDDFATTQLGNPWDMLGPGDIDAINGLHGGTFTTIPAEWQDGTGAGNINVYTAVSDAVGCAGQPGCAGDAYVLPLAPWVRGASTRIDPTRYRALTVEMGVPGLARDINLGSVARVVWHVAGEEPWRYNVSQDIVIDSRAGANTIWKLTVDMRNVPLAPGGGSPSTVGWNSLGGNIDGFRIDPHEFPYATPFFIKRVKLAALEVADTSYTVRWTSNKNSGVVRVYTFTAANPNRVLRGSVSVSSTSGSFVWNTTAVPAGEYFIYVEFDEAGNGANVNGVASKFPIRIDHTPGSTTTLQVNRPRLNFGVTNPGFPSQAQTASQTIRVSVGGSGSPCWMPTTDIPQYITLGTGTCGPGSFTVSLKAPGTQAYPVGDVTGNISITCTGANNCPRVVPVLIRTSAFGASAAPIGFVDTPAEGENVAGSIGVTGWAADDIDLARVTICRDALFNESAPPNPNCAGQNKFYVGDATLLEDARPDLVSFFPDLPRHYRFGWGYLLLTNFLPAFGNGAFRLRMYGIDVDGHQAEIGSKGIVGVNQGSETPFGAIDTPAQGATVCGSIDNFGWVLTPWPATIPFNGSTIQVLIDNVSIGGVSPLGSRPDVHDLFLSGNYNNIDNHLGVRGIDTTLLSNGVHTIAWLVFDDRGNGAGVGSRYFTVVNPCTP